MTAYIVLGSCVSRDILRSDASHSFDILDFYAATSFISFMSRLPISASFRFDNVKSSGVQLMVSRDATRHFQRFASGMSFDYLLLDFIDQRYDVLEIEPERFLTMSEGFSQTNIFRAHPWLQDRVIHSGSVRFKVLWREAFLAFIALADSFGFKSKIIVNRAMLTRTLENGRPIPGKNDNYFEKHNELLEWMYALAESEVGANQVLRFPKELLVSKDDKRCEFAPLHYADEYYRYAAILLRSRAIRDER